MFILSLVIAILMAAASIIGLLNRAAIYPTDALVQSFVPSDGVNLVVGLPILLGSMWLARRGRLVGLLLWPGALLFVLYNYIVYVFAVPLTPVFALHLTLLVLSTYTVIALAAGIDGAAVRRRLAGAVPERLAGGILGTFGLLFLLRVGVVLAAALTTPTPVADTELALHIADSLIAPALIVGGVLLWRRRELGYVAGLGLLFQTSMLFIGLIIVLIVQPFLTGAPFALIDVIVVSVMGMVSFIPFSLFVRGTAIRVGLAASIGSLS